MVNALDFYFLKSENFSKSFLSHIGNIKYKIWKKGGGCDDAFLIYGAPKFSIVYVVHKITCFQPWEGEFSKNHDFSAKVLSFHNPFCLIIEAFCFAVMIHHCYMYTAPNFCTVYVFKSPFFSFFRARRRNHLWLHLIKTLLCYFNIRYHLRIF